MNIVCLIHSLAGGGAERGMAALASRLARHHRVSLVTLDNGTGEGYPVAAEVERRALDLMQHSGNAVIGAVRTHRRVRVVRDAIVQLTPDVVLSFCDRTNILALLAMRSTGIPTVISERSDPARQPLGAVWEFLRRRTYPTANTIVAQTEQVAQHLQRLSPRPVTVIPGAVEPPRAEVDRPRAIANRRILGVGRLEKEKGFERLIAAFAALPPNHDGWTLRIVGSGSQRESLLRLAASLGVANRVELPGWQRDIGEEFVAATIFALPSHYEGFPTALLEAMSCGVPSVAVDCDAGPRVIIQHAENGLLVPNQTQALAEGLKRLVADDRLREQLGAAGKSVADRFSWDAVTTAYQQVLQQAIA